MNYLLNQLMLIRQDKYNTDRVPGLGVINRMLSLI